MARKVIDCRVMPSESHCSLTITGEEDEVVRAAAQHAVDVHGHTDGEELRRGIQENLQDSADLSTNEGAFVQIIEFRTRRIGEVEAMMDAWADAVGANRTARWGMLTGDREQPDTFVEVVEFPNYDQAMANSNHPATTEFADKLRKLSDGDPVFRNLDVRGVFV
jgi:predicted small metal-binding protein/quinol monooxygenase YgiN